jgi:hypothetical protein
MFSLHKPGVQNSQFKIKLCHGHLHMMNFHCVMIHKILQNNIGGIVLTWSTIRPATKNMCLGFHP